MTLTSVTAPVLLANCIFEHARASAIQIVDSSPTIRGCWFRANSTPNRGGAILVTNRTVNFTVEGCEFTANDSAQHGGAIAAVMEFGTTLRLRQCQFDRNACNRSVQIAGWNWGGGVYLRGNGDVTNCVFQGNEARTRAYGCSIQYGQGGGFHGEAGDIAVQNSVFVDNYVEAAGAGSGCWLGAEARGGALSFDATANNLTLDNCVFSAGRLGVWYNWAGGPLTTQAGGVFVAAAASVGVRHCVFRDNSGDAVAFAPGTQSVTIKNSILFFNNPLGTIPQTYGPQFTGNCTVTYSDIQNGAVGTGNISANPFFVGASNMPGGSVIHLVSPCVDAGDPTSPPDAAFPPARGSARADMGAHGGALAASFAPPCIMVGGAQPYGLFRNPLNLASPQLGLAWTPSPTTLGGAAVVSGAAGAGPAYMFLGGAPAEVVVSGITLLVAPGILGSIGAVPFALDTSGSATLPFDLGQTALLGYTVFAQVIAVSGPGFLGSNGLAISFY